MTGIQAAAELPQARSPSCATLMLSMYDNEQFLFEALKAGASGYVLKSGADDDIVEACRAAMRGQSFLYPSAVATLVRDYVERGDQKSGSSTSLTPRELEVLKLIAEAHTSKEIASELFISIKTVERHRAEHPRQARHARPGRAHPVRDPPRSDPALAASRVGSQSIATNDAICSPGRLRWTER